MEYENARCKYCKSKSVIYLIGMFVNELHYKIVCNRKSVVGLIILVWLVLTIIGIYFIGVNNQIIQIVETGDGR